MAEPKQRRWLRNLVRALVVSGLSLLGLLLAVFALAFAIVLGWQRQRVVQWMEGPLSRALGVPVDMEQARGALYRGLVIQSLRVGDPASPFLEVDRVEIAWHPIESWMSGEIRVDSLRLVHPVWRIVRDPDGRWRAWPGAGEEENAPPRRSAAIRPFEIGHLEVEGGEIEVEGLTGAAAGIWRTRLDGEMDGLELPFDPQRTKGPSGRAELALLQSPTLDSGSARVEIEPDGALSGRGRIGGAAGRARVAARSDWRALLTDPRSARTALEVEAEDLDPSAFTGDPRWAGRFGAALEGEVQGGAWKLGRGILEGDGLSASATGSGDGDHLESLRLDVRADRIGPWLARFDVPAAGLDGPAAIRAELAGPFSAPEGKLDVDLPALSRGGRPLGRIAATLVGTASRRVRWRIDARAPGTSPGSASGEGWLALDPLPRSWRELEGGGRLEWDALDAASLDARAAPLGTSSGLVVGELARGGRWKLASGRLDADPVRVEVAGTGSPDRLQDLTLDLELRDLALLASVWPQLETAAGQARLQGRLRGPIAAPAGQLSLSGESLELARLELGQIALELASDDGRRIEVRRLDGRNAQAEFTAAPGAVVTRGPGEAVSLSGLHLDFRPTGESPTTAGGGAAVELAGRVGPSGVESVRAHLEGLDAAILGHWIGLDVPVGGRLFADVDGSARGGEPVGSFQIQWEAPLWGTIQLGRFVADGALARGVLSAEARATYEGEETLFAEAHLPLPATPGDPVAWLQGVGAELHLRSRTFRLAALEPFLPRSIRRVAGEATGELLVRGDGVQPRVDGRVELVNGAFDVPVLRRRFAPINGVLRWRGDQVWIDSLTAGTPGAGAEMKGRMLLDGLRPVDIDAELVLSGLPLARSPLLRGDLGGRLELRGSLERPVLRGELILRDAGVTLRNPDDPAVKEIRLATLGEDTGLRERVVKGPDLVERSTLDLTLIVPSGTRVTGEGANLDVNGRLRLVKAPLGTPRLQGEASVVHGFYRFQGRRFHVRQGQLNFTGEMPPDPLIDVEAEYRVSDITAIIYASGRVSNPVIRLGSEPDRDEADVLSYLIFGRPASELEPSQGGNVNVAAARLAVGVADSELRAILGESMPLDVIELHVSEQGEAEEFEVGKYVTSDLMLRYGRLLGDRPGDKIGIEYRFDAHWSVESSITDTGDAGVDLFWRYDY